MADISKQLIPSRLLIFLYFFHQDILTAYFRFFWGIREALTNSYRGPLGLTGLIVAVGVTRETMPSDIVPLRSFAFKDVNKEPF